MSLPPAAQRVVKSAATLGLQLDIHVFPAGTKTSADAAAAVGCELSAIAKSLVFVVDEQPVVAILSGDHRLDAKKLASLMGAETVRRATLEEAKTATGYAAGGTPAFGYTQPLPVFLDRGLQRHDEVWSAAGTPTTVYPIPLGELIRVAGARVVDIAEA